MKGGGRGHDVSSLAHTDGGDEGRVERVLGEPEQHASLAYAGVADQ